MQRFFIIILCIALIFGGIYGAYYFSRLQRAESAINGAIVLMHEGNFKRAQEELTEVISEFNHVIVKAPALYLLAQTYIEEKDYNSALSTYKILIYDKRVPITNRWYIQSIISMSRLARRNYTPASPHQLSILKEYISAAVYKIREELPGQPQTLSSAKEPFSSTFREFAAFNFKLNISDVAISDLLTQLETELGFLHLESGEYDSAIRVFTQLDTPLSKFGLARAYIETGEGKKGLQILEGLIEYDKSGGIGLYYAKETYELGEDLVRKGRLSEALDLFERVGSNSQNTIYGELSFYSLAKYYYASKNYRKALSYTSEALSNTDTSKDEEMQLLKGYIYYDTRDYYMSLKAFREFVKKYPDSARVKTAREWIAMSERSIKYLN